MVIARDEETIWLPPHAEETAASSTAANSTAASSTNVNSPDIGAAGPELVRNLPGGGDLLTAILAGLVAHDRPLLEAAQNASKTAQTIIAKSRGTRDLDLLAHLNALPASG
jgi:pyridoxal/pyridoxine/pyridoxamine kinase